MFILIDKKIIAILILTFLFNWPYAHYDASHHASTMCYKLILKMIKMLRNHFIQHKGLTCILKCDQWFLFFMESYFEYGQHLFWLRNKNYFSVTIS